MMKIGLTALAVIALVGLAVSLWRSSNLRRELASEHARAEALREKVAALETHAAALRKYEGIVDAEQAAQRIKADAESVVRQKHADAMAELDRGAARAARALGEAELERARAATHSSAVMVEATAEAARIVEEAKRTASRTTNEASAALSSASAHAQTIVTDARGQAEAIAADALDAKRNAKRWEQTADAMKALVDGYGDQYVIPGFTLIDGLADEFGFAEAGQKLKEARDRSRQLVKDGVAAACDYVEANRRETAIKFVLDAFNGKVDSILADVGSVNIGTLRKKLENAFVLVNQHGQAFRNARITDEYLSSRRNELDWAATTFELKDKAKEEQRALRERIREEEKVQRDIERARKEAEKEEDMLRRAMEKVQREVGKATDEQKLKYEEQLRSLGEQLKAAEEKNQRALSMAQQTKSGHVYVISNVGSFGEDVFKIGLTRRLQPLDRIKELGDASVPFDFDVHALIPSDNAPALEKALHKTFLRRQVNKVNPRKEFFRVNLPDIRQEVDRLGLEASWTMLAECKQYKETVALERALATGSASEKKWVEAQLAAKEATASADEEVEDEAAREAVG